jgi:hypothetical protein
MLHVSSFHGTGRRRGNNEWYEILFYFCLCTSRVDSEPLLLLLNEFDKDDGKEAPARGVALDAALHPRLLLGLLLGDDDDLALLEGQLVRLVLITAVERPAAARSRPVGAL